jgi:hypothetical protein
MGPGKLAYQLLFKPTLPLRYHLKHFGLAGWIKLIAGEKQMKTMAANETAISLSTNTDAITFSFLTGKNYWYQTIYAIKSLHFQIPGQFRVRVYSDGSLMDQHISALLKFAPGIMVVTTQSSNQYADKIFPRSEFPALRFLRDWHPFFKRMLDIHCTPGWSIHLDSDMLFFNKPEQIINAFTDQNAIYMQEAMDESYFVDKEAILKAKYGIDCMPRVNGGIIGYNNDSVDYRDLESKAQVMIDHYLNTGPAKIEQTLMSYLLFQQDAVALDKNEYAIFYDTPVARSSNPVVKHYIFKAKFPYFTSEWKTMCR